ncbi:MAG: fumarylacetoacetate hydrolase family protein, partial [Acetobacteraceae bacterium]|nr:fumarylacetoacetate hydrolase family protein [Acetobacteraceae bacterium]
MSGSPLSAVNDTHDPARRSWVQSANDPDTDFPIQNLPLGVFRGAGREPRGGIAIGDRILDLAETVAAGMLTGAALDAAKAASGPTLNPLMALGNQAASALRSGVSDLLRAGSPGEPRATAIADRVLVPMQNAEMALPAAIGSFTDFLTSLYHTERGGRHTRPDTPVPPNFKHLPVAYNSRASSVRISGEAVRRPNGQFRNAAGELRFGPCEQLDFELEVAQFVGPGNAIGEPIAIEAAPDAIFGFCLLNDWSARDVQR